MNVRLLAPAQHELDEAITHQHRRPGA